jgi:hypothetical protein
MSTVTPLAPPLGADLPPDAAPRPRAAARAESGPAPVAPPAMPNPSLRLDPALGQVVLEFRDQSGRTATLPTERELAAYRSARGRPDPTPPPPLPAGSPGATAQAGQASNPGSRAEAVPPPVLPAAAST